MEDLGLNDLWVTNFPHEHDYNHMNSNRGNIHSPAAAHMNITDKIVCAVKLMINNKRDDRTYV